MNKGGNRFLIVAFSTLGAVVIVLALTLILFVTGVVQLPIKTMFGEVTVEAVYVTTACSDSLVNNFVSTASNDGYNKGVVSQYMEDVKKSDRHWDDTNCVYMVMYDAATNVDVFTFEKYYDRYQDLVYQKKCLSPRLSFLTDANSLATTVNEARKAK